MLTPSKFLSTEDEVVCNNLWRFLQLRGYVDEKRILTSWGKILETTLSALDPADGHEEGAFLAVELLRLGVLNAEPMFPNYTGAPSQGSGESSHASFVWLFSLYMVAESLH